MADWAGQFGDEYNDRNAPDIDIRAKFFKRIIEETLSGWFIDSVFEIGCNVGTNLLAIRGSTDCQVSGCDINDSALQKADQHGIEVFFEDATDLDHESGEYDLVFTAGVQIHLSTSDMIRCMKEMHRVSTGLVMFLEYKGNDIEVPYRGHRGALVKREYGDIYQALFPGAELVETGFLPKEMGFDDVTYWVFYDSGDSSSAYGIEEVPWESDARSDGEIVAASLTGEIGAVRVDRLHHCSYGAGVRE